MPDEPALLFYGALAEWWPLISPAEEYAAEAAFVATVLRSAAVPVREVLELGSGGGHNASHLKAWFTMTLVDRSEDMLAVSRRLNPECEHVVGDMRTVRLGRCFDAVFVHDAVDYLTDPADLRRAMDTAYAHCRPGGIAVFIPDDTAESFVPGSDHGGSDAPDGRGVRYLEWTWDPDPGDSWVLTEYAFVLRGADGSTRSVHETHRIAAHPRAVWFDGLAAAGFEPGSVPDGSAADGIPRELFTGRRPL